MAKKKNIKDVEVEEVVKEELEVEETETGKVEVKEEKKTDKKEKKEKAKKEKKDTIGTELKKVVWPSAGSIVKYTLAVLVFCLFLGLFFKGIDLLSAFIKGLFK